VHVYWKRNIYSRQSQIKAMTRVLQAKDVAVPAWKMSSPEGELLVWSEKVACSSSRVTDFAEVLENLLERSKKTVLIKNKRYLINGKAPTDFKEVKSGPFMCYSPA